jgi:hypothetical protein
MTISRRDTLRLAAAAGTAGALAPFAVDAEHAAALLAGPADHDEFPVNYTQVTFDQFTDDVVDPVSFAIEVDSTDFGFSGAFANGAAEEWAAYKLALDRVVALAPDVLDYTRQPGQHGQHGQHPMVLLDDLVVAMGNAMHRAGIVQGVAYEHLRLAQVAPRMLCDCNGHGCATCDGAGTLPTPRPTLGFWPAD